MNIFGIFSLSINILLHSKLRSWLTILGIVIGIGSFITIFAIGDGMEIDLKNRMNEMDLDILTITTGHSRAMGNMPGKGGGGNFTQNTIKSDVKLTDKDIFAIKSIPGVEFITGEISGQEQLDYLGESSKINIKGVDAKHWFEINNITLTEGRFLDISDKTNILLGEKVSKNIFTSIIPLNRTIIINGKTFRVVGIVKNSSDIIMPITSAINIIEDAEKGVYANITVKTISEDIIEEVQEAIEEKLRNSRHVTEKTQDFTINSNISMVERMSDMSGSMISFLSAIAAISLIVGAVGIANTMFTSVLEKTKQIGIMKSIGSSNKDILFIFLINSALFGFVGGLIGVGLSAVISPAITLTLGFNMGSQSIFSLSLVIYGIVLALSISVLSGIIPAYRASKLKPVDALRYE
jgi:putative ABC transport system permease protein